GAPTAGMVYKLVSREDASGTMVGVAKKSKDKQSVAGRKFALRRRSSKGIAEAEVVGIGELPTDDGDDRNLLVPLVRDGERVDAGLHTLEAARARHTASLAELPAAARRLQRGEPAIATEYVAADTPE
ncbi:MAG: nicotinate phosphoribosyltransferase, partial [Pedococcus sp.]